jgi:hypothetical protein
MADLKLFVNTSNNTLSAGQLSSQSIDAASLPFFCPDTFNLVVYLLQTPLGYNAQDPSNSKLQTVSNAGMTINVYLNDGTLGGVTYASALGLVPDPSNTYATGVLSLNTDLMKALCVSPATRASCWIKIVYVQNGLETTVLSQQVNIGIGVLLPASVPIMGQTPLSVEVANATYLPKEPVAGLAHYLESPNGKIFMLAAIDNADGTATFVATQIN